VRSALGDLVRGRLLELSAAVALGYAAFTLADSVARSVTHLLAQHLGRAPFEDTDLGGDVRDIFSAPGFFNFEIGGTVVFYGPVLSAATALGLVALLAWFVVRRRDRELGECPFCASRIPYESTHCAYCGSGIAPCEP
jgi:hypothetical protein